MKYIWEEKDITGGLIVTKTYNTYVSENHTYIIGYDHRIITGIDDKAVYRLISVADGLIFHDIKTSKEMCDLLNKDNYRPIKRNEYIQLIKDKFERNS